MRAREYLKQGESWWVMDMQFLEPIRLESVVTLGLRLQYLVQVHSGCYSTQHDHDHPS